ncbi:MAG TPA: hypothetical protein VG603_15935 [Chitinophagales bacterium]|nr:hypothetical protein [Chitinophagales bacterium]
MAARFKWYITSPDTNDSITLDNDPVGWQELTYTIQRHQLYQGIFKSFAGPLKFHNRGGGKDFVDTVYKQYDIDGRAYITLSADTDGRGNYEELFTGRLNFATYAEDGTFTTLYIEASDIYTKMLTRADVPVTVNPIKLSINGLPEFEAIELDNFTAGSTTEAATHIFDSPFIESGNTFIVITTDVNGYAVTDAVDYEGSTVAGPGGSSEGTTLQITAVIDGQLTISYANCYSPVYLYVKGSDYSLGQEPISSISPQNFRLQGIGIQYEAEFKIRDTVVTGTYVFGSAGGGINCVSGYTYVVYTEDVSGNQISSSINYTGSTGTGSVGSSNDSSIQITAITDTTVTVAYTNINGNIDLWSSPGGGAGVNNPIATVLPTTEQATQQVLLTNQTINAGYTYRGYQWFDAYTVFDNFGDITFSGGNDVGYPGNTDSTTAIPPVFDGFADPVLKYPVSISMRIRLKGTLTQSLNTGVAPQRTFTGTFFYKKGIEFPHDFGAFNDLFIASGTINSDHESYSFDFDTTITLLLNQGDKIWIGSSLGLEFLEGAVNTDIAFTWEFTESDIDFQILTFAAETNCEAVMVHEAFNQVVDSIADSDGNFYSEFYGRTDSQKRTYASDGEGSAKAITNGLCLRGHTDRYISASFNQLFKAMQALDNIGMTIDSNNRVRIEKLSYFYDADTILLILPNVNEYARRNDNTRYYNQVDAGYNKYETEIFFKNGLDEIHSRRSYATRVGSAKGRPNINYGKEQLGDTDNKLNIVSDFIAGNYAIELTRRKNLKWAHDDFKYDNDNFILEAGKTMRLQCQFAIGGRIFVKGLITPPAGTTLHISGSASNDGSFTIKNYEVYRTATETQTTLFMAEGTNTESYVLCTITFQQPQILTAASVLQTNIENVIDPVLANDWLNMTITPARILQNHMNKIVAGLQTIHGQVQFLTGTGNYNAVTQMYANGQQQDYNGHALSESASLDWDDSLVRNITPIWGTEVYVFDYPLTYKQFRDVLANPHGLLIWNKFPGVYYFGFILTMTYNLNTGMAHFELIQMGGSVDSTTLDELNSYLITENNQPILTE